MKRRLIGMLLVLAALFSLTTTAAASIDGIAPIYLVTAKETYGGQISVAPSSVRIGDTVTVTAVPDAGFRVEEIIVKNRITHDLLPVRQIGKHTYTFVHPDSTVYVEAVYTRDVWSCPYVDITPTHWAYPYIRTVDLAGVMDGTAENVFNPADAIPRQQVWLALARMSGENPANATEIRAWAVKNGISDGSNPNNAITRQQFVTLLYRYSNTFGTRIKSAPGADLKKYSDADSVAAYAAEAMSWAVGNGIMSGTADGNLNPTGTTTRAHVAKMLAMYLEG